MTAQPSLQQGLLQTPVRDVIDRSSEARKIGSHPISEHQALPTVRKGPGRATYSFDARSASRRPTDRALELHWLTDHRREYAGLWVAVDRDRLVASDKDANVVFAAVKEEGIKHPFVVHLESVDSLP